jgi:hypothetical protein
MTTYFQHTVIHAYNRQDPLLCLRHPKTFASYSSYEEFQTTKTTKIGFSLEGLKVTLERGMP